MLVGLPSTFAIESEITCAYARLSFRALGFFVIHVAGHSFGVRAPDASMLACSFDEVGRRLNHRGEHTATFSNLEGFALAKSVGEALYDFETPAITASGFSSEEFSHVVHSNHLLWAPDGDEAFYDSSFILHFDIRDEVRLVGFKSSDTGFPAPASLAEARLSADTFYGVLAQWHATFEAEWRQAPKKSD